VAAEEKLRRLVRRLELNSDDAVVLVGMLRQIAWKLGANDANENDVSENRKAGLG
jgi:tRNA C32,U32 (ribose-2'-O)-methylase TrmJ